MPISYSEDQQAVCGQQSHIDLKITGNIVAIFILFNDAKILRLFIKHGKSVSLVNYLCKYVFTTVII